MSAIEVPDAVWDMMKSRLGYDDEELARFKGDPRNARVLAMAPEMMAKTIVFEVVESQGCNSQHREGSCLFYSGDGNLLTKLAPSKVCGFLLPVMAQMIYGIHELWYAGVDPNTLAFKRAGCFDVGVKCGGWGHVVVEARVLDRGDARELFETART